MQVQQAVQHLTFKQKESRYAKENENAATEILRGEILWGLNIPDIFIFNLFILFPFCSLLFVLTTVYCSLPFCSLPFIVYWPHRLLLLTDY